MHERRRYGRRRERVAMGVAFAISFGVHVSVAHVPLEPPSVAGSGSSGPGAARPEGIEIVRVEPVAPVETAPRSAGAPDRSAEPEPIPAPVSPRSPPGLPRAAAGEGGAEAPAPGGAAAARLRSRQLDPRLWISASPAEVASPAGPVEAVRDRNAAAIRTWLDRPGVRGRDSLSYSTWAEDESGVGLRPGALLIGGITVPFCGGAEAARCGFGARPWDLGKADREAELQRGLEEQARWEDLQDRAREWARRRAGGGG
jgi:hypothetical protein